MCHSRARFCKKINISLGRPDAVADDKVRAKASHLRMVMVDGRVVVENGRVLTVDEEAVGRRLAEVASRARTEKEKELAEGLEELRKHVVRYYQGWADEAKTNPYFAINSRE